jgi:hypothetical protein
MPSFHAFFGHVELILLHSLNRHEAV